ncbi:unnamed protein product [Durusdinium trenchii]|uniref:Uncharacterized protein n=1 Tax=Durusdinium trenchii TaxID=1381693 RepID=A0ABP0M8C4_9DINO
MRLAMRRIIVFVIWWHLTLPLASQSAWQQRFLNEVNSTALQRSSAATPKLLARLDGADTRAFLARCCPEVAQWPAADLAETLRQNLRAAEVVSGFSSEVNRSFFFILFVGS